jgi:probable F420-dependent oxidoreductase
MGDALETFSILGLVAGATERLRLVTSVLVLPYRNPVLTAKMAASLDVLSGGRLTLGVGAGWLKEEFEALNSPAFETRGTLTDEWITMFKQLWSESPASFDGRFYRYSNIRCEPFPVQKPHPPIWIGGHSRAALRRTARHGDGCRRCRCLAVAATRDARASRHLEAADRGRGARFLGADNFLQGTALRHRIPSSDGSRRPFSGTPDEIAGDIQNFATIGVHELVFDCRGQSIAESVERLQWFATDVTPLVDG